MKKLLKFIFPFPRSGLEANRGVEFSHSTLYSLNVSRIRQEVEFGGVEWSPSARRSVLTLPSLVPSAYHAVCGIRSEAASLLFTFVY